MVPSESAPQELSNEWSCQCVSTISNVLGNFRLPPLVTEVAISPYKEFDELMTRSNTAKEATSMTVRNMIKS
jgi:hypothetical protein